MRRLLLSLSGDKQIWALNNPFENKSHIKDVREKGFQNAVLIFTDVDRGPKEVVLEEYPEWAKRMILSSIRSGDLINSGDSIKEKPPEDSAKKKPKNKVNKKNSKPKKK